MASQAELDTLDDELGHTALIPAGDPSKDFPPEPRNFGETPTFGRLTLLFEALQTERKQDKRRATLQKWFSVSESSMWGVAKHSETIMILEMATGGWTQFLSYVCHESHALCLSLIFFLACASSCPK
jgi:hypothetical protein